MAGKKKPARGSKRACSWFKGRTGTETERGVVAGYLKGLRRTFFDVGAPVRNRGFGAVFGQFNFKAKRFVAVILSAKGKLNILDSGAGFHFFSADLKKSFGNRVFVTALNPVHYKLPKSDRGRLDAQLKMLKTSSVPADAKKARELEAHLELLETAEKNAVLVDENRVGMIETFRAKRKYGLVFDFYGPIFHSRFKPRVLEAYLRILEPNGILVTTVRPNENILALFGPKGGHARQTGFFLQFEPIEGTELWKATKMAVKGHD